MGLLDSVLGQVLGGAQQQPQGGGGLGGLGDLGALLGGAGGSAGNLGGLAGALGGLLANNGEQGGLGGLVSKFEQAGMGDVIGSWVGKGENAPITGGQLQDVLGSDAISGIAQKLGINSATLLPMLATLLPTLIDHLTPKGQVPAEGLGMQEDLLSSLSGLLQKS
ncbi:MAG: YidB family protein [Variovorax sp.]